ncbi:Glycosyltransferase SypQ [Candidatus Enterovibrio escicola]|uniref:Glycosyltransferase SypQ n=3 Tax=Candidatus Enterovibrio escicola TaxID=1927127 RepID=A0A2A5T2T2_9GAMM|nr:Glycosyltransferase SypQ [Candidatus Enterovibrio escacola]
MRLRKYHNMDNTWIIWVTAVSTYLVIYHHLGYPLLLRVLVRYFPPKLIPSPTRSYNNTESDNQLSSMVVLMPAYNEAKWIADKIRNLSSLDYPSNKLCVILACDGCTDNTAYIASETLREVTCQHLKMTIIEYEENEGKVAVINKIMPSIGDDIVVMSDVSALISVDALLIAATYFIDPLVGVVNGRYQLLYPSKGEKKYWEYQSTLQYQEAQLGSTLGAHGALYLFRRSLFSPLEEDTINDDFVLPTKIVARGYRSSVDKAICAIELEPTNANQNFKRRLRIGAGNYQQLLRLMNLLHPQHGGIAFTFISGKALRVVMPFLMLTALLAWLWLAQYHILFAVGAALQSVTYIVVTFFVVCNITPKNSLLATLCYLVSSHTANMLGALRYIVGLEKGRWQRVCLPTYNSIEKKR